MKAIIEHVEALQAANEAYAVSSSKLAPQTQALADANRILAVEAQRQAAYTDLAARAIVDPDAVPAEDLEAATSALFDATSDAAAARTRIPALERAIGLLKADVDAKGSVVREARQRLDSQTVAWLKSRAADTFERYRSALNEAGMAIAVWNAHSQLIDALEPANAPLMVYTGSDPWNAFDCQAGPDQNPFRQSERGRHSVKVAPSQVKAEMAVIRGELLEQAGVRI